MHQDPKKPVSHEEGQQHQVHQAVISVESSCLELEATFPKTVIENQETCVGRNWVENNK